METAITTSAYWSAGKKLIFRFLAAYFLIYCFFNIFGYSELWMPLLLWLKHLLKMPGELVEQGGSGDATYNYLQLIYFALLAIVAAVVWSVADRKRRHYDKLLYWAFVMIRYVLAYFMVLYGFSKVFKQQFPFPFLQQLLQPLGSSSPMGLAWKFMGYSPAFNVFTGMAEMIGGILIMFRRTATFGALFCMTVLSNVVAMNFCYDIPVKLFSLHLLAMATLIAIPDAKRLIDFFFRGRAVPPAATVYPVLHKYWMRATRVLLKVLVFVLIIGLPLYEQATEGAEYGDAAPRPPLYGIYTVDSFVRNNVVVPPLTTDSTRWRYFVVDKGQYTMAKMMDDQILYFDSKTDTLKKRIIINIDSNATRSFDYTLIDSNRLGLSGVLGGDTLRITLSKKNLNDFTLINRGFHWISEYPYNR